MARTGRKPLAAAHVEHLEGSPHAKQRLVVIIKTMLQELTIPEACSELGIGESRFHAMRNQWMQRALEQLEPRRVGRPRKQDDGVDPTQVDQLRDEVGQLQQQLVASEVRRQIGQVMPQVVKEPDKKGGSAGKRKRVRPR